MSKEKQKGKKSKEATAKREDETSFMGDSADTSLKTGHKRSPGATGGEGSVETSEVSGPGEEDHVKKKRGTFKKIKHTLSKATSRSSKSSSKHSVQSPTSPTSLGGDSLRQSEETEEPLGTDISVQKPSTISSCDSQASGGPVSPSTEERIHELEQRLQNTEGMSSKTFEEELQHKEQEVSTELQKKELEDKLQELQEKVEALQQQQQQTEMEMAERDRKHEVEIERKEKQYELQLDSKQKQVRTALQKQLRDKDETINAKDKEINDKEEEIKKLQEQLAQKEVAQQRVRSSQIKVVQDQESELKKLKEELIGKEEEVKLKLREKDTQVQRFVQKADKQLQESQTQLQQEQERHAQETKQMIDNYEAQLQEATQQHEVEKSRLLSESQLLQEEQKRALEEMADKVRQHEEQQQDIPQQSVQGTDRVTKEHEVQMEQLKQQHKRALEEKDRQLTECQSRLQEETQRYEKDMMKRLRDFQAKLSDADRRHKAQLDDRQKQYDLSLAETRKHEHDALELQVSQMKRSHEKELKQKEEEYTHKVEEEIQQREQVLQRELQQKDQVLQQELQQREQKLHQQDIQLRRYEQKIIEKDAKIAQLESDLSGMIPSSEPPSEENVTNLHSNVVDLAREISHYVDPENVLPSVQHFHHLTPPEVERIVEVLGGQEQLQEHKPQNYCFAVLPANNQMKSVLFDYTGTFRPCPDGQVCPSRTQEEDGFHTPPSSPTTEVPRMFSPDADASDVAANLPDSEKVKRLQKALDGHIRLHADMKEEVKSKTDEVEHWQNEIADLRREMEAKDEQLRAQGEEIQVLRERVKEKEQEIEEKLQSIEDSHKKVEQRDKQLEYLKKPPNEADLNPKALEEYDKYFGHVLKLTEELTDSEATVKKQQQELEKLQKLVERAERMEEQVTRGTVELSEKEQEIKELSKHVRKLQHTVGSGGAEQEDGVDRLQLFEHEAKELKIQLEKAQDDLHEQEMVQHQLQQEVENLSGAKVQLEKGIRSEQEHVSELERKLEETHSELEVLKEKFGTLELQLRQREFSFQGACEEVSWEAHQMKKEMPDLEILGQVRVLKEKLQARDDELRLLRQQGTGNAVPPSQASLKYDDLPTGTDPKVEIATLKQVVQSKDQKIESLQVQVHSFESVIQKQEKLLSHTKEQSKQVLKLRQELEAAKKEKQRLQGEKKPSEEKMEDQTGVDLWSQLKQLEEKLALAKDEKRKLEEERDSAKKQVDLLCGDLEVTQTESTKETKKWEAKCAELDGEMLQLQITLSDAEHDRQKINEVLVKVKQQRNEHEQKYLALLSVNENLKSQTSQMECMQREVVQVKREASQWKDRLSDQNTVLSKQKGEVEALTRENDDLRREAETLRKENDDLKGEVEARKLEAIVWKEDFQKERSDRQQAAGRVDDERARRSVQDQKVFDELQKCRTRIHQCESENKRLRDDIKVHQDEMRNYHRLMTDFEKVQLQLVQHKEQLENMEQLFQAQQQEHKDQLERANRLQRTQLEDVHRQLRKANEQLDQAITDNEKLNDDILAKTQQVKQYKKQVDGLKVEVTKYKSQRPPAAKEELDIQSAISESKQTETARQLKDAIKMVEEARGKRDALQAEVVQLKSGKLKLEDAMKMLEETRGERDALQAEVVQLKSEKMNERHFSAAFQKEFEKRGEFQAKYHEVLDRCAELFEQVQQLRSVLEYHKIRIPDPPPKQRAPPADISRAMTQQPQALISRSSEGALHPPRYHGDPAAHHTSPPLQTNTQTHTHTYTQPRADLLPTEIPPEEYPHPPQQYEFHQPPTPIQALPQQGGDQIYEPREQAWAYAQQYERPSVHHAQGQSPQQHARISDQPHPEARYNEDIRREDEAITKDLAVKVQMQHEDENIKALLAQQNAAHQQGQDRQFHQEHELAHHQHGHIMQGYSVDDPRYGPFQHQGEVGPSGHSSLPTSSFTAPQPGEGWPRPQVLPNDPQVPGIMQYGDLAVHHHTHGPQHPNEVDPHLMTSRQQLEKMRHQKQIEQQQILQAQEQMRAQQQMVQMETENAHRENIMQPVHGYPQGHQGYPQVGENLQMQGIPQVQPGMAQHLLGAYHGQHPVAAPRLYGDSPLPQSQPRHPLPAHNVSQPPVSPHPFPPGRDRPGQYPVGLQPGVPPRHLPPGSEQAVIPDQYAVGMQPTMTPSAGQTPQEQYPQVEPITPTEEANRDHAPRISKPVEETCPDVPEQRQKQVSAQQDENRLMKGLDTEIHDTAADVQANVQSKEEESLQDAPMDPNLVCPMCGHGYRVGEIQRYRRHVKSCRGSKQ